MISPLYTIPEAAAYLRCSIRTLKAAVAAKRVQSSKSTGRRMFRREWLDAFIDGQPVAMASRTAAVQM